VHTETLYAMLVEERNPAVRAAIEAAIVRSRIAMYCGDEHVPEPVDPRRSELCRYTPSVVERRLEEYLARDDAPGRTGGHG